jgi:hypothetical protein
MRSPTSDVSYVQASPRLSDKARQAMDDATAAGAPLMISTVAVVYEILDAADSGFEGVPIDGPGSLSQSHPSHSGS